jgi:NuA3 HAT complex component NTO1
MSAFEEVSTLIGHCLRSGTLVSLFRAPFKKMAPRGRQRSNRRRPGSFFRDEGGAFRAPPRSSIKPREERPYQEFHPDLDVSRKLLIISSNQTFEPPQTTFDTPSPASIIPQKRKASRPLTPLRSSSRHSLGRNGSTTLVNGQLTPKTNGVNGDHSGTSGNVIDQPETPETPCRDVGNTLSVATPVPLSDRSPLEILRRNFAMSLPMSRAETDVTTPQEPEFEAIAPFKDTPYIGKSMADVGYQESEYWSRPRDSYIRFYRNSLL